MSNFALDTGWASVNARNVALSGEDNGFFRGLCKRGLYASPFLLISLGLLLQALQALRGGGVLFAFTLVFYSLTLFLVGAIILVPALSSRVGGSVVGSLFSSAAGGRAHLPPYSQAEALVKQGHYKEALAKFQQIATDFPDELRPWLEMISVAVQQLGDLDAAFEFYSQARDHFQDPETRRRLLENYKALKSLKEDKPEWLKPRTVGLPTTPTPPPPPPPPASSRRDKAQAKAKAAGDTVDPTATGRRCIQFRKYDDSLITAPPDGYLKAASGSLAGQRPDDDPTSTTQRLKMGFALEADFTVQADPPPPAPPSTQHPNLRKKLAFPFNGTPGEQDKT